MCEPNIAINSNFTNKWNNVWSKIEEAKVPEVPKAVISHRQVEAN